jgi:NAD+ synthase (glutamine-hydrolysing)
MRVCIAQINPIIGDLKGNTEKILTRIEQARVQNSALILFPELSICGYPPADFLLHKIFIQEMEHSLERIRLASTGLTVVVGLARSNQSKGENPLFNSAAILQDGRLLGFSDKCLLPTYDVFDERRYFEPGGEIKIWEIEGKRVAILICEDIWQHAGFSSVEYTRDPVQYPRDPILELVSQRPELLLTLSASPYQFQKPAVRIAVCAKAALTLHCPVILCNQVGGNDDLVFDGYSLYLDQRSQLQQIGEGFAEDFFSVDLGKQYAPPQFLYEEIEDLYRALVLGVRDYFVKQGFKRACLGLSGGIDSALVACIAVEALGAENVLGVSMPSRYSSQGSVTDAQELSERLGMGFQKIPIEGIFEKYLQLLTPYFEGRSPDTTEENLQARIRGMILMALSNKLGYTVLSTGNKSELGLGYCTLYGDMCGGFGVIADLLKTQVYEVARFLNQKEEIIPQAILEKAPSAELRAGQKDRDSLPEYAIVDRVLKDYVEDYWTPKEIAERNQFPLELVNDLIERLYRAEYKRRQAPPGIRVSKKAFSVGRLFPIVQKWV